MFIKKVQILLILEMATILNSTVAAPVPPDLQSRTFTEMLEIIIYGICFLVGAPLNVLSFYRLWCNFRNSTAAARSAAQITLLRLNLNIADLLTMFVYTTSQIVWMLTYQWYGGDLLCRICKFFHTFGFYLNSFVVACIAIDRVFGTYNLSTLKASRRSYLRCRKMLIATWICAFFFSLPQSFVFRVFEPYGTGNFKQCTPVWTIIQFELDQKMSTSTLSPIESQTLVEEYHAVLLWERIYNITHLLFVFWIPALIIVASYVTVLCLLNSFAPSKSDPKWKRSLFEWMFNSRSLKKTASPTGSSLQFAPQTPMSTPRPSMAATEVPSPLIVSMRTDHSPSLGSRGRMNGDCKEPLFTANGDPNERSMSATSLRVDFTPRRSSAAQRQMVGAFALQTISRARSRTKRQAALIIVAYLSFWTPYNLLAVVNTFAAPEGALKQIAFVTLPFLNGLLVLNPIVNPIVYGLFDRS
ncbi:Gonadotropin-releasing hormone receptor [Aphelenchoides besseyi]|nr:Gonadotropin-releasing hormone receptor [Aphelenchoides besseyi]